MSTEGKTDRQVDRHANTHRYTHTHLFLRKSHKSSERVKADRKRDVHKFKKGSTNRGARRPGRKNGDRAPLPRRLPGVLHLWRREVREFGSDSAAGDSCRTYPPGCGPGANSPHEPHSAVTCCQTLLGCVYGYMHIRDRECVCLCLKTQRHATPPILANSHDSCT